MHGSWRISLLAIVVIISLTGLAHAAELGRIQQRYAKIQDFTATFRQETFQVIANKTVVFEGKVTYKRGSGVRMDVTSPERQILILKGSTVLVILPDQGTSQVQDIPPEIAAQNILGFFTGLASIEDHYAVQKTADHLVLTPKAGTGSISVWVNEDSLIRRILLKDAMGNTSDIQLSGYRFNTGIGDALFNEKTEGTSGDRNGADGDFLYSSHGKRPMEHAP
ncbi:MAG TPA: outer membrane lipoprotein carrier protein LolA [Deltaproteobacteria bacterium]|nr:outer membrane lipoprotein carrier protein LolA [Deltaproteobacteria bacterium]HPR53851.1 outer membrane lipoprotein carrier protein LolA [Deltaproteobacteria bacterium]HXK45949.1 outer membrane lipoprotein carrier protein LolA [Deltaproteobacteria bacterium]